MMPIPDELQAPPPRQWRQAFQQLSKPTNSTANLNGRKEQQQSHQQQRKRQRRGEKQNQQQQQLQRVQLRYFENGSGLLPNCCDLNATSSSSLSARNPLHATIPPQSLSSFFDGDSCLALSI